MLELFINKYKMYFYLLTIYIMNKTKEKVILPDGREIFRQRTEVWSRVINI